MITKEKLEHHWSHLKEKHDRMDKEIKDAYLDNVSDIEVEKMKKQKLKLKDEMEACKRQIENL
jgi:uncharacterized protein YdcH (DUF465 family)